MKSKLMTLALVGAAALGVLGPDAVAGARAVAGNAHSPSATAISGKRLPPQMVSRVGDRIISPHASTSKKVSSTAISSHANDGKK
jgi:hypothetical protein